jgi:hypothetical protein
MACPANVLGVVEAFVVPFVVPFVVALRFCVPRNSEATVKHL